MMTNNIFNQMAKEYDSEERVALANIIANEVKEELDDSKDKSLLDYGGGTGLVSLQLADLVDSVTLVDASKEMVNVAESKISELEIQNAMARQADYTNEMPEPQADIILVSLVLLHIPETKNILQSLYYALNPGGKVIIVDFDKKEDISHPKVHNGFTHGDLNNKLATVGFEGTKIHTFHHGEKVFMKQDASMFIATSRKK